MYKTKKFKDLQTADPGIVLFRELSQSPVAYNPEAVEILVFPDPFEEWHRRAGDLALQISDKLAAEPSLGSRPFVAEFKSGNRTYLCRVLRLGVVATGEPGTADAPTLLILERPEPPRHIRKRKAWDKFGLSPRESQMVELLVKGMTTKDIADALSLSPNTVKSFLRTVMAKLGVSTRAGIVGKLHESLQS